MISKHAAITIPAHRRVGIFTRDELRIIKAAKPQPTDCYGDAGERMINMVNRNAGTCLCPIAQMTCLAELIAKL